MKSHLSVVISSRVRLSLSPSEWGSQSTPSLNTASAPPLSFTGTTPTAQVQVSSARSRAKQGKGIYSEDTCISEDPQSPFAFSGPGKGKYLGTRESKEQVSLTLWWT